MDVGFYVTRVLSPYNGQKYHLETACTRQRVYPDLISSVDAMQGNEHDIIILSCVRSNSKRALGFVHDPRRLNVAITRARRALIVVGNAHVLQAGDIGNVWCSFLGWLQQRGFEVQIANTF